MKRKYRILMVVVAITVMILSVSCSGGNKTVQKNLESNEEELAKLPENFPIEECPLYAVYELVSVDNRGSDSYFSYEITFNSKYGYEELIELYGQRFPDAIAKDLGIVYCFFVVPDEYSTETVKTYMLNYNIYSDITKGTNGMCTVVVSVSEY